MNFQKVLIDLTLCVFKTSQKVGKEKTLLGTRVKVEFCAKIDATCDLLCKFCSTGLSQRLSLEEVKHILSFKVIISRKCSHNNGFLLFCSSRNTWTETKLT